MLVALLLQDRALESPNCVSTYWPFASHALYLQDAGSSSKKDKYTMESE